MQAFVTLLLWFLIGSVTAHYAKERGRTPWRWFFIGLFLGIFGLLLLFILPKIKKGEVRSNTPPPPLEAKPELPNPSPHKYWYYLDAEHNRFGPLSYDGLKNALREGKIFPQTYVWNEDFADWKHLKETMSTE